MPLDGAIFGVALLLLIATVYVAWTVSFMRPRAQKAGRDGAGQFLPGHVHQGAERSRHEVGGRTVIVAECHTCGGYFNLELP